MLDIIISGVYERNAEDMQVRSGEKKRHGRFRSFTTQDTELTNVTIYSAPKSF